jgi:trk system potassium uptake protein TrkH
MNYLRISRLLGILLLVVAGCMATSIPWSWYYEEPTTITTFLYASGITVSAGFVLWFLGRKEKGTIFRGEAILVVGASWLLLGVFGGIPYLLDGAFTNPADAYFETISGFTTTGSTVLEDIEGLSMGLHWWRCLTHWLGGMGIIVLFVAIFPQLGVGGKFLFKSEVPGPITEGLKPKIKSTASTLWWIYVGFTLSEAIVLRILGMTWHDAFTHAFATMATGGFSTKGGSIGSFGSVGIDFVVTFFMLVAGINFGLYYDVIRGKITSVIKDRELWTYLGIIAVATTVVTLSIYGDPPLEKHGSLFESFRYASFQVLAIVTTTGFGTDNFNLYPPMSKMLLVILMFVGGMAGSTAGGMKIVRLMVVFKAIYVEIYKTFRPQTVMAVRIGKSVVPRDTVSGILAFFAIGILVFAGSSLYMTFLGLDLVTGTTAVIATLFNIGPGLARVGSIENFAFIPDSGKVLLSLCMILGRLEFITILVLFLPQFWQR